MKKFIIKLLFKLIGSPFTSGDAINEKRMFNWLAIQYPLPQFRDYIKKRDMEILQVMGNMVSREDYLICVGQRSEIGRLLSLAKENYDKYEKAQVNKQKKAKLEEVKRFRSAHK